LLNNNNSRGGRNGGKTAGKGRGGGSGGGRGRVKKAANRTNAKKGLNAIDQEDSSKGDDPEEHLSDDESRETGN
jgi:hypothetical protein